MKHWTGGDPLSARQLYTEQEVFYPQAHLHVCCNDVPRTSSSDHGTWRRIRILTFDAKFVKTVRQGHPEESPIDEQLEEKIKTWDQAYLWLLIQYKKLYPDALMFENAEVLRFTEQIRAESDPVYRFRDAHLRDVTDEERAAGVCMTIDELYHLFVEFVTVQKIKSCQRHSFIRAIKETYETVLGDVMSIYVTRTENAIVGGNNANDNGNGNENGNENGNGNGNGNANQNNDAVDMGGNRLGENGNYNVANALEDLEI